jgi:hypothetical protein
MHAAIVSLYFESHERRQSIEVPPRDARVMRRMSAQYSDAADDASLEDRPPHIFTA